MKKNVLIIIGLLLITPCHAQTVIDTVTYRFIYDFQAKTYENSNQLFPDEHWLDIGKNGGSKYYSHWHALRRAVADSIRSSGGDHQDGHGAGDGYHRGRCRNRRADEFSEKNRVHNAAGLLLLQTNTHGGDS